MSNESNKNDDARTGGKVSEEIEKRVEYKVFRSNIMVFLIEGDETTSAEISTADMPDDLDRDECERFAAEDLEGIGVDASFDGYDRLRDAVASEFYNHSFHHSEEV